MKNNKGITLIALVVTIIVLLILAGVSIAMLTGQNGILTRANDAKTQSTSANLDEAVKIVVGNRMTKDLKWTELTSEDVDKLKTEIKAVDPNLNPDCAFTATDDVDGYMTITSAGSDTVFLNAVTGAVTKSEPTTKTE